MIIWMIMIQNAIGIFKTHYDLGEIIHAKELTGGFCNHSFAITARMNDRKVTYLVRRYNPRTSEKEMKFLSHGLGLMNGIEAQKDKIGKAVDQF